MGSIVSILVVGAIYLVVYVVKSLGTAPGNDGGKPFGESFPTIEGWPCAGTCFCSCRSQAPGPEARPAKTQCARTGAGCSTIGSQKGEP